MTKNEKKEVFLLIIENWFNDKSEKINSENCIGFYFYFLDCLEFETKFSPEYEPGFHKFLLSIYQWLSTFDVNLEKEINKNYLYRQDGLKKISSNFSLYKEQEKLELFLSILHNLYNMSKDEYFYE